MNSRCPECNTSITEDAIFCFYCGAKIERQQQEDGNPEIDGTGIDSINLDIPEEEFEIVAQESITRPLRDRTEHVVIKDILPDEKALEKSVENALDDLQIPYEVGSELVRDFSVTDRQLIRAMVVKVEKAFEEYGRPIVGTDAYLRLGVANFMIGEYGTSITMFEKALSLKKEIPNAWEGLAFALDTYGNIEKSRKARHQYNELIRTAEDLISSRNTLASAKDFKGAIKLYSQALDVNAHDQKAYYNMGLAYKKTGMFELALAAYSQAIKIKPDHESWNNKGTVLAKLGRYREAVDCFNEALTLKPDYDTARLNRDSCLSRIPGQ